MLLFEKKDNIKNWSFPLCSHITVCFNFTECTDPKTSWDHKDGEINSLLILDRTEDDCTLERMHQK